MTAELEEKKQIEEQKQREERENKDRQAKFNEIYEKNIGSKVTVFFLHFLNN